MSIQVNKYAGRVPEGFGSELHTENTLLYTMCTNCGAEMECKWIDKLDRFEYKKNGKTYETPAIIFSEEDYYYTSFREDKVKYCGISQKEAQEAYDRVSAWLREKKSAQGEKETFQKMTACPICHGDLKFRFRAGLSGTKEKLLDFANIALPEKLTDKEAAELEETYYREVVRNGWGERVRYQERWFNYIWMIKYIMPKLDKYNAAKKAETLLANLDATAEMPFVSGGGIKESPDRLKEYIHKIFTLESNIYSLGKRLEDLYIQQYENDREVRRRNGLIEFEMRDEISELKKLHKVKKTALQQLRSEKPEEVYTPKRTEPSPPPKPVLEKPGLFNKKKVLAQNEELTAHYQKAYEEYELDLANYRQEIADGYAQTISEAEQEVENARIQLDKNSNALNSKLQIACSVPNSDTVIQDMLKEEVIRAENLLKEMIACRKELYAHEVVFIKYRNLVALASFYEYLMSGRCVSLEGADGAYNIFEAECRANQIVGQLAKIVDSLEQIKDSQYMVYAQLRNINSSINAMNSTMKDVANSIKDIRADTQNISGYMETLARNSDVIAHNTAVNAYYSKMNADLTNSLGYLVALH